MLFLGFFQNKKLLSNKKDVTLQRILKATMVRRLFLLVFTLVFCLSISAQTQQSAFEFLKVPISSKAAALGGNAVSITDSDPTLSNSNPALLDYIENHSIGLSFMNYIANTKFAGIQYNVPHDNVSSYAISINYVDYGTMDKTESDGTVIGTFSSKDMNIGCTYSYRLGNNLSGGVTGHIIYSRYGSYSSVAACVDLGLLYAIPNNNIDLGFVARSIGGQIKPFENQFEKLPFNLIAGISWKPEHAPIRLTMNIDALSKWDEKFAHHFSFGADFNLTEQLYLAAGCNLRNRMQLSGEGKKGFTGIYLGTGINLKRILLGISYGQYQISTSSLLINFAYNL